MQEPEVEPDRPRLEPSGASDHARGAAQRGRAGQEADEPTQDQELEPDSASSRGSVEWGESHDEPTADEMSGGEESSSADERPNRGDVHFDHLSANAFALAKSAALLPEFRTPVRPASCIDAWCMKPLKGTCTQEDIDNLNSCMSDFFLRRPVLQSTPPKEDETSPVSSRRVLI